MTSPLQLVLTVVPLAGYFYLLAIWQAGRHPRVISGTADFRLLAAGVGGLVLFGPFGQLLARMLFGRPDLLDWATLTAGAILLVLELSRRAIPRLVIYHVDREALELALRDALGPHDFIRTHAGFEDRSHVRGVRVEHSPRWQSAAIEPFGPDPGLLIRDVARALREKLGVVSATITDVPVILFALSALTMLLPLTGYLLAQPGTLAALRGLLEHLRGG